MTPREFAELRLRTDEIAMERDKTLWNHTASILAMMATEISGKAQDPDDFNPYAKRKEVITDPKALISFISELNKTLGGSDVRPASKRIN